MVIHPHILSTAIPTTLSLPQNNNTNCNEILRNESEVQPAAAAVGPTSTPEPVNPAIPPTESDNINQPIWDPQVESGEVLDSNEMRRVLRVFDDFIGINPQGVAAIGDAVINEETQLGELFPNLEDSILESMNS